MYNKMKIREHAPWLRDIQVFGQTGSTQREARMGSQSGVLYLTERQSGTYGRFGRPYFAAEEGGIYMSLLLEPVQAFADPARYTLLTAAAVITAIERLTDKKPQIKWVNDIYLMDRKIAGILVETVTTAYDAVQVIIGIGLNFSIKEFPSDISRRAGSLFSPDEVPTISRERLIGEIWQRFDSLSEMDFLEIYRAHSLVLGREVSFKQNDRLYKGMATDLTERGELVVLLDTGERKILNSGEISLEAWN